MARSVQRTKIVATLGPATSERDTIAALVEEGLDVARLNFSHGSHEEHRRSFELVREVSAAAGRHVAVLADLCGPKIRVGELEGGSRELREGESVVLSASLTPDDPRHVPTSYSSLAADLGPGDPVLLDDGRLRLEVAESRRTHVICRVEAGGVLTSHKGINLPGSVLSTPALTTKDRRDLAFARELGVDCFALSFVRRAADVIEAKALAGEIPVIAKMEKPEAVACREEIVEAADGLMVARGDLGVEAGAEKVPLIQKQLVRDASARAKPVIVATQMLESMISSPTPTRAEISDVANAVLDGADALMLSGETAVGAYPVEVVRHMAAAISEVEASELFRLQPERVRVDEYSFSNAVARAAVKASQDLQLKALVVYTESGRTAELVSAYRPQATLVAFCRHPQVLRRLNLRWGIQPVLIDDWVTDLKQGVTQVERTLLAHKLVSPGDDIGITFGMLELSGPGRTNVLQLWRVRESF